MNNWDRDLDEAVDGPGVDPGVDPEIGPGIAGHVADDQGAQDLLQSRTLDEYRDLLLGGPPTLTARELAQKSGRGLSDVREYLLAMGFQPAGLDVKRFTEWDLHAFEYWGETIMRAGLSWPAASSLTRAQSHLSDRLALWEVEALVEDAERRHHLDDTAARVVVIAEMRELIDALESQMLYAWRTQMFALIERMTKEVGVRDPEHSKRRFPLNRAFGFVDMVAYTWASSTMGDQLVGLVEQFEYLCRSVVTESGGRVVKMLGDSVFFIADDLEIGLKVVTELITALEQTPGMLPVRASFIQGDVFSRSGDVFGPSVNLAARLADVAPKARIITDAATAAAIDSSPMRADYSIQEFPSVELRGVGRVSPYLLSPRRDT